ncbi:hypothetical protein MARINON1_51626 [Marinobacter salarius]|nr:hypothetical protein MBHK15_111118 [Marinobacter salarius]VXB92385.1 hypothetical protein MARINON1_51626 [Marinobacter salarius]
MEIERMFMHFLDFPVYSSGARLRVWSTRVDHSVAPFFDNNRRPVGVRIKTTFKTTGYFLSS